MSVTAPLCALRSGTIACAGVFAVIGVLAYASFTLGWRLRPLRC